MKPPKATKAKEILISKDIGCRLTQMLPLDDVDQWCGIRELTFASHHTKHPHPCDLLSADGRQQKTEFKDSEPNQSSKRTTKMKTWSAAASFSHHDSSSSCAMLVSRMSTWD
jgi:hypothetical protein